MKKLNKLALTDAKVMTPAQMKHITGGSDKGYCYSFILGPGPGCDSSSDCKTFASDAYCHID